MEIKIITKGTFQDTEILLNGQKVDNLFEFHFSVHPNSWPKMQVITQDPQTKKHGFNSMFRDDFRKFDE